MQATRNQKLLKILGLWSVLLYAAGLSLPVFAATSASDMSVTVNVNASCTMGVTSLDFGTYDPFGAHATQALRATATVSTTCTSGATGVVTMTGGLHPTFCMSSKCYRRMANAGETSFLRYNIYTNASYSWGYVWTDNPVDVKTVGHVTGSGISQDLTVYGEVHKNQPNVPAGSYTDRINVTLRF